MRRDLGLLRVTDGLGMVNLAPVGSGLYWIKMQRRVSFWVRKNLHLGGGVVLEPSSFKVLLKSYLCIPPPDISPLSPPPTPTQHALMA